MPEYRHNTDPERAVTTQVIFEAGWESLPPAQPTGLLDRIGRIPFWKLILGGFLIAFILPWAVIIVPAVWMAALGINPG